MSRKEELRRKDNCISCQRFIAIKAKDMCQNCWHKVKRKNNTRFFLSTRYTEIYQRCRNVNNNRAYRYNGLDICTREQFINKFIKDFTFNKLFENWKLSGYENKLSPSVDRIDNSKGYTIDNIQFLTHSQNCLKDQKFCPVNVYSKHGDFIGRFESQNEAERKLNIPQANIWKVLNGERKTAGGYVFTYA